MADAAKTGNKSGVKEMVSPRSGARCPTGAHPGNTGGKKGRSGRKPVDFVEWCRSILNDPTVRAVAEARAKSGDLKVVDLAAKYSQAEPPKQLKMDATVTFKAERE
jgi:hypothetical protein